MADSTIKDMTFSVALSAHERREAVAYIEAIMRKSFECEPPPTVGLVCVIRLYGEIAGSIVLQDSVDDALFPIERHYEFQTAVMPLTFPRDRIIQGTRWTAAHPGVSLAILRNSFALAYGFGKRYMLIEAKPYSVKRLAELRVTCKEIESIKLIPEKVLREVGSGGMEYYLSHPAPTLCMIELAQLL
jgi:hypothetical protein